MGGACQLFEDAWDASVISLSRMKKKVIHLLCVAADVLGCGLRARVFTCLRIFSSRLTHSHKAMSCSVLKDSDTQDMRLLWNG